MITSGKKVAAGFAAVLLLLGFQTLGSYTTRHSMENRIGALERDIESVRAADEAKTAEIATDVDTITGKIGVTAKELEDARHANELLAQEHTKTAARLRNDLATNSKAVSDLRDEATSKIAEVENNANDAVTKIGAVSGDVQNVKTDLDTTKNDVANSRKEMGDLRDSLGRDIARNSTELAALRLHGERDYTEFDLPKSSTMQRVGDIQLQLKKTDPKKQRFDVTLLVDDAKLEKKGLLVNEPTPFLSGRDKLRYELVVFSVDKDRIRGYVSSPKDKGLSAEGPTAQR